MSRVSGSARIDAPPGAVWAVLVDVEAWPAWASQFARLELLDGGPLALGSKVRVKTKGQPASVWQVTDYDDGHHFTWTSRPLPGLRLTGGHELTPDGVATNAEFWLEGGGAVGVLLGPLLRRTIMRRNTANAAAGLKRQVEAR